MQQPLDQLVSQWVYYLKKRQLKGRGKPLSLDRCAPDLNCMSRLRDKGSDIHTLHAVCFLRRLAMGSIALPKLLTLQSKQSLS